MMNDQKSKNNDFMIIYNKLYRLAAAVFAVSKVMDPNEELGLKIKNLSIEIVSLSVNLKDVNFINAKKLINDIEKNTLLLMSFFDMAAVAGLVSQMNGRIIKEEFENFIKELDGFVDNLENQKNGSVKDIFANPELVQIGLTGNQNLELKKQNPSGFVEKNTYSKNEILVKNTNGSKRKDVRKNTILDFIKGHPNVSIKDIIPNIVGCSEKTIQRELIALIKDRKIKKEGERRWSRYSLV